MQASITNCLPAFQRPSFTCPHCRAFSHMRWERATRYSESELIRATGEDVANQLHVATCAACQEYSVWRIKATDTLPPQLVASDATMMWPTVTPGEPASPDMPPQVRQDYEEARAVAPHSVRAAAALLRLAIQRLCTHLGATAGDINNDIGQLVKQGLNPRVQEALDYVRVVGNEAVHPGLLNDADLVDALPYLFSAVQFIVMDCITRPRELKERLGTLPPNKLKGIKDRDGT